MRIPCLLAHQSYRHLRRNRYSQHYNHISHSEKRKKKKKIETIQETYIPTALSTKLVLGRLNNGVRRGFKSGVNVCQEGIVLGMHQS